MVDVWKMPELSDLEYGMINGDRYSAYQTLFFDGNRMVLKCGSVELPDDGFYFKVYDREGSRIARYLLPKDFTFGTFLYATENTLCSLLVKTGNKADNVILDEKRKQFVFMSHFI